MSAGTKCLAGALHALVGLTRARSKDQMQLALLQLHQAIAAKVSAAQPPRARRARSQTARAGWPRA